MPPRKYEWEKREIVLSQDKEFELTNEEESGLRSVCVCIRKRKFHGGLEIETFCENILDNFF